jgi:hypothetical protein
LEKVALEVLRALPSVKLVPSIKKLIESRPPPPEVKVFVPLVIGPSRIRVPIPFSGPKVSVSAKL